MRKTILVVDDESDIRTLLEKILGVESFHVVTVGDGRDMHSALERGRPDLIVMDLMLPGSSGFELCTELKSNPMTRDIPILVLSVMIAPQEIERVRRTGANAYLAKPFEPEQLVVEIRRLLES